MTTNQMVVFVKAFARHTIAMGWNKGTKQITSFANRGGTPVDLIKCYRQIDKATLKTVARDFERQVRWMPKVVPNKITQ
jgi:hypothetical protein